MKALVIKDAIEEYLSVSKYINWTKASCQKLINLSRNIQMKFLSLRLFMSLYVMK